MKAGGMKCVGSLLGVVVVVMASGGCSSSSEPSASSSTSPSAQGSGQASNSAPGPAEPVQVIVPLGNEPSGTVTLNWDPQTKFITAKLKMAGLTPGSAHAMHIHQGSCSDQGDILIPFTDVSVNDTGDVDASVQSVVPTDTGLTAGTLLNIHLASSQDLGHSGQSTWTPISCANIDPASSLTLQMAPLPEFGEHPQSQAILDYDPGAKTLTVSARATGLVAGSAHAVHIHDGSCDSQGGVMYHLNDLVAGADGVASTTTVVQNVEEGPPATGWYVNVHLGGHDQIEKDGKPTMYFAPILCGNVGK